MPKAQESESETTPPMSSGRDEFDKIKAGNMAAWFIQTTIMLILIWIALNGFQGLWTGVPAALGAAAVGTYFARGQTYPWHPLRWLVFSGFFLFESLKAGADVAWRALHPRLKIQPGFEDYRIVLPPGLPTTMLTSTISLLPGTLSVHLREAEHCLVVHALAPSGMASVQRLERMLAWVFRGASRTR